MTVMRRVRVGTAAARAASETEAPERPVRMEEKRGTGRVTTKLSERKVVLDETDREIPVLERRFAEGEQAAYVKVGAGLTIDLGGFQFLRVDCSVSLPCLPSQLEETYEIASQFVADKVGEEQNRWLPPAQTAQATSRRGGR